MRREGTDSDIFHSNCTSAHHHYRKKNDTKFNLLGSKQFDQEHQSRPAIGIASRTRSKADFISKIEIGTQEADETLLWLEVLKQGCNLTLKTIEALKKEPDEWITIFVTMSKNSKS